MEVTQISPYKFNIAPRPKQIKPKVQNYVAINQISNICYQPIFTGISSDEEKLKNIPDIKCACCGHGFVSKAEYKRLGSDEVTNSSATNIQALLKHEHKMKPIEKQVFEVLKDYSEKFPQENFQQLLQRANRKHLPMLEDYQRTILNSVKKDLNKMLPDSKIIINDALDKVGNILFNEPKNIPQKRYRSIQIFDNLFGPFIGRDKELILFDEMCDKIISLPSSGQNVDAFIAKYAHRSPGEISQRLLMDTLPTIEHVVATSNGGEDDIDNKIILCKDCNKERSNYSYSILLGNHPEMKENLQLYIDKVIEQINLGKLTGLEKYALSIKQKFGDMKLGLDLDISKLSVSEKQSSAATTPKPTEEKSKQLINLENRYKQNIEDFEMDHPILTELVTQLGEAPKSVQEIISIFALEEQKLEEAQIVIKQLEPKISHIKKQQEESLQLKKLIYAQKLTNKKISLLDNKEALEIEIAQKRKQIDEIKKELPPTTLSDEEIVKQYTKAKKYILRFDFSIKKAREELVSDKNLEKYTVKEQLTRSDLESFKREYPALSKFMTNAIKKNFSVKTLLKEFELKEQQLEKFKKIEKELAKKVLEINSRQSALGSTKPDFNKAMQCVRIMEPKIQRIKKELANKGALQKYLSKKTLSNKELKEFQHEYPELALFISKYSKKTTSITKMLEIFRAKEKELAQAQIVVAEFKKQAQKLDKANELSLLKTQLKELLERRKTTQEEILQYPEVLDRSILLQTSRKLASEILVTKNESQDKTSANTKLLNQYLEHSAYIKKFKSKIIKAKNELQTQNKSEKYLQKEALLENLISDEPQQAMPSARKDAKLQKLQEQLEQKIQTIEELSASIQLKKQSISKLAEIKVKLEQSRLENAQAFKTEHPLLCAVLNNFELSEQYSIKEMLSEFNSKEKELQLAEDKKLELEPKVIATKNLQNLKVALDKLFEQKRALERQWRKLKKSPANQVEISTVSKLHKNIKKAIERLKEKITIARETTVENPEALKQYAKIEKHIQILKPKITAAKNELAAQNKLARYMQNEERFEQELIEIQNESDLSNLTALLNNAIAERNELSAKIAKLTTQQNF